MVDTTGKSAVSVTSAEPAGESPDKSNEAPEGDTSVVEEPAGESPDKSNEALEGDTSAVEERAFSSPQEKLPENNPEAGKEGTEIGIGDDPAATDVPDDSEVADASDAEHEYEEDEEEFHSEEESEEENEESEEAEDESEEAEEEESEEVESEEETTISQSSGDVNEYRESDDGYIHLNEKQKSKIRELTQPDEEDDIHLGFTKQGKPIVANPYYKYALRLRDVADVATPKTPPTTQTRASRHAKLLHREESSLLPAGPSMELENIKEQFCEWLSSLGSKRNMSVTKERLEELFSLGLETNMVVRPPDVRMVRAGQTYHASSQEDQQPGNDAPADEQRKKRVSSVAFCRSPSLTYYPDLKHRWELMAMKSEMPTWQPAYHPAVPPPPEKIHYGEWYIPIKKWTPLVGSNRLTPPETEEARELRKREQMNLQLNQVLSKSHALAALREYIRLCQAQGGSAYVPTPNMMCDVDALLASQAGEKASAAAGPTTARRGRNSSRSYTVRLQVATGGPKPSTSRRQTVYIKQYRRSTYAPEREPMKLKPPPKYRPTKTKPGRALAPTKKKYPKKPSDALNVTTTKKTADKAKK